MVRRLSIATLAIFLVAAAASGWYLYRRDHRRLVTLQNQQLAQQKAIDAIAKDYKIGTLVAVEGMAVRYRVPREISTPSGSAIIYDEFVASTTKYTEIQRLGADGSYRPITLADIKTNENIVVITGPDGAIVRLYAITR